MKVKIAVLYGGYSSEHDISVLSGKYVSSIIDKEIFEVYKVHIQKNKWTVDDYNVEIIKSDFSFIHNNQKIYFDAVVIVIHGTPGEDGKLQSYFDLLNIPYTSSNALSSALTFSKFYCNFYLRNFDIKIANSILVRKNQLFDKQITAFVEENNYPLFIKPNAGGSSFGTTKVKTEEQLKPAIKEALKHSDEVIIEQFIAGREFTCGVYKTDNKTKPLTPCEIRSKNDFFDYESKYNSALNEEIIPAPLPKEIFKQCQDLTVKIFNLLNCKGIARADYILDENNNLYFLEINTIPGMTSESIIPKMIKYEKINIKELFTKLIEQSM
jgi:D-alanine-D-alanine ligase